MQNSLAIVVLVCLLGVSVNRLLVPAHRATPIRVDFRTDAIGQLDMVIADSIHRQRELNDQLDKTIETTRRASVELRNFRHNP